jgi:hypothetical protein
MVLMHSLVMAVTTPYPAAGVMMFSTAISATIPLMVAPAPMNYMAEKVMIF